MTRLSVPKTYKLYIGGKFPRSESGRTYEVVSSSGDFLANAAKASRKDARDAVVAARAAQPGWASTTAYNRGQVLYRVAEMLEARRSEFIELERSRGAREAEASRTVGQAIDLWVWYAGWADKYAQVAGNANPVSGPYFNISVPEPTGVVAVVGTRSWGVLGLAVDIAPAIVSGNAVVLMASEVDPRSALVFAEVLATSDVPAGVVNILTGSQAEIAPWLASHADVNGLDLSAASDLDWIDLMIAAADTLKRVREPSTQLDWSLDRILAFTETKTVWHTKSMI